MEQVIMMIRKGQIMSESMKDFRIRVEQEGMNSKTRSIIKQRIRHREKRRDQLVEEIIWYRHLLRRFDTDVLNQEGMELKKR